MKSLFYIVITFVLLITLAFLIYNKYKHRYDEFDFEEFSLKGKSPEFLQNLEKIYRRSFSEEELDEMHEKLIIYARKSYVMDINMGLDLERTKQKRNEPLPDGIELYGCRTYGDAQILNSAAVKVLDEFETEKMNKM